MWRNPLDGEARHHPPVWPGRVRAEGWARSPGLHPLSSPREPAVHGRPGGTVVTQPGQELELQEEASMSGVSSKSSVELGLLSASCYPPSSAQCGRIPREG